MNPPNFEHIQCRPDQGVLIVNLIDSHLSGDDLAESLRSEMLAAVETHAASKWIIDFSRVQFFTSAGIRPLLTLHRKLQSVGARLVLSGLRQDITEVFHATRLLATTGAPPGPFEAASSIQEALHMLRRHLSRVEDGILILTMTEKELRGEELADDLGREMIASWQQAQPRAVVLDFTEVEIITTPCIRALLQLRNQVKEKGGQVALCGLSSQVAEVFSVTRLIGPTPESPAVFQAFDDVPAALNALRP